MASNLPPPPAKAKAKANSTASDGPPRLKKTDYNHIHRHPLPMKIYPLPPLIPHNPLSILHIALAYFSQIFFPPEKPAPFKAYFCSSTSSIQVTDPETVHALWEMGFFGKGSLSRSEPTWLEREKKRRGVGGRGTSEDATRDRRAERRDYKLERAKKEQEAIAEKLRIEAKLRSEEEMAGIDTVLQGDMSRKEEHVNGQANGGLNGQQNGDINGHVKSVSIETDSSPKVSTISRSHTSESMEVGPGMFRKRTSSLKTVRFSPTIEAREFDLSSPTLAPIKRPGPELPSPELSPAPPKIVNQEYLHLSHEEAFFLVYGLGVLQIYLLPDDNDTTNTSTQNQQAALLPASSLLPLLRRTSYFPPRSISASAEPDDPFLISYAVYHHFRSLGWIVRSGVKFSVDYLLYNRGPVFAHAEFAVVILPSYSHPYWSKTEDKKEEIAKKERRPWGWLHGLQRVQAQVRKSLVLVYVEIPPRPSFEEVGGLNSEKMTDIGALLRSYKVREFNVKRWIPNRSRD